MSMFNIVFALDSSQLGVSEFITKTVITISAMIVIVIPILLVIFSQQSAFKKEFFSDGTSGQTKSESSQTNTGDSAQKASDNIENLQLN